MKDNYIHVCFIIDSSSSMSNMVSDVTAGFDKIIKEQKENDKGQCSISLFTFGSNVEEKFVGKDVKEVDNLDYNPMGLTAMNDGIGTAIDKVGAWLRDMKEEDRPSKVLVVIMTDGEENNSREYSLEKVKQMIDLQTNTYNWTFTFVGCDVTNKKDADNLGIKTRGFSSKKDYFKNYDILNDGLRSYRCASMAVADSCLNETLSVSWDSMTEEYEKQTGVKLR